MSIHNNTYQYNLIHTITYKYTPCIPVHTDTNQYNHNKFFHMVSIGLYCVRSIQTNTCQYMPNTCQYMPILNTNGDETRRVSRGAIHANTNKYIPIHTNYRPNTYQILANPYLLTLRVLPPFVFRIGMYWHVFGMYEHVLVCTLQTQYRPILTI